MMYNNKENNNNGVNGASSQREGPSPGRCSAATSVAVRQRRPDRQSATARQRWTKEMNKIVMRCFYYSEPKKSGFQKRMLARWKDIGVCECSDSKLLNQCRSIKTNGFLSEMELKELEQEVQREKNGPGVENEPSMEEEEPDVTDERDIEDVQEIEASQTHSGEEEQGIQREVESQF